LGRAPNVPSFFRSRSVPYRSSLFGSRHSAITRLRHRTIRFAASIFTIQCPYRRRHRGGLAQYIFSSPARHHGFSPTTLTYSRATELKMLCIIAFKAAWAGRGCGSDLIPGASRCDARACQMVEQKIQRLGDTPNRRILNSCYSPSLLLRLDPSCCQVSYRM
jgi:hypothetical protein